jgi:inner membrane protein
LQHRGHTHTVIAALLIGLVLLTAVRLWHRWRGSSWSRSDATYLCSMALLAPLLHIGLDFTNSYGVHPFWPLDNHWYYGDAVFIVDPLLWTCATPLLFALRSTPLRLLLALTLLAGVGLAIGTGMVPTPLVAMLVALMLVLAVIGHMATIRAALASGVFAWLGITAIYFISGGMAKASIGALMARDILGMQTLDLVTTPLPVNPFCREIYVLQADPERYIVRKAAHSVAPDWFPATACPVRAAGAEVTAPWQPVALRSTNEIGWIGEIVMPRSLLRELAQESCAVRGLLQFARVPWTHAAGSTWIAGDLRYDREPQLAFAEIEVSAGTEQCPTTIPGWIPPREDVLTGD